MDNVTKQDRKILNMLGRHYNAVKAIEKAINEEKNKKIKVEKLKDILENSLKETGKENPNMKTKVEQMIDGQMSLFNS